MAVFSWNSCLLCHSVVYSLYLLDIHVIISQSIIYPGCLNRARQHTTYCFPVWPVFLLTWCYSSHSRPAQLSIWAECVCVCVCDCLLGGCVYDSDPGLSVLSAVGAVLHISHMTASNLALPDRTGLTNHRTHAHNTHTKVHCVFCLFGRMWVPGTRIEFL